MNITQAVNTLGADYINKVTDAMKQSATLNVPDGTDGDKTFDSVFNSVSGLLSSTNDYIQQAQQAEIDFALGNLTNTHELGVYQQQATILQRIKQSIIWYMFLMHLKRIIRL